MSSGKPMMSQLSNKLLKRDWRVMRRSRLSLRRKKQGLPSWRNSCSSAPPCCSKSADHRIRNACRLSKALRLKAQQQLAKCQHHLAQAIIPKHLMIQAMYHNLLKLAWTALTEPSVVSLSRRSAHLAHSLLQRNRRRKTTKR